MNSADFNKWRRAPNKDRLEFYQSAAFRDDYTRIEMGKKAKMFKKRSLNDVKSTLREICTHTDLNEIRILSLGCGPGSDLLGILGAADSVLKRQETGLGWETEELKFQCIGVDAFDWDRRLFKERVNQLYTVSVIGGIDYQFVQQDMQRFVYDPYTEDGLIDEEFDFICLSFADAGRNLELIGTTLPQLLSDFGRILVLDNDIPSVRCLSEFGFTCSSTNRHGCMLSRGRLGSLN